jgi:hypothetical protein
MQNPYTESTARASSALFRRLLSALCILNSEFLFAAWSGPAPASETNHLVVAQRTSPNSLDPRLASDEATARISQLAFSSLLSIGDDLRPLDPDMRVQAARFRVSSSWRASLV